MNNLTVISSRVRLARNYMDFPFNLSSSPESAQALITRTVSAVDAAGIRDEFNLIRLSDLTENQKKLLEEERYISEDLLKTPDTAAVMLNEREHLSIMMNEEDHLRIQAVRAGEELQEAADSVFRVDDAFSREVSFAFDRELGYPECVCSQRRASALVWMENTSMQYWSSFPFLGRNGSGENVR